MHLESLDLIKIITLIRMNETGHIFRLIKTWYVLLQQILKTDFLRVPGCCEYTHETNTQE